MNKFQQPFYLVDFTSSICDFEIYINDMPVFIHNEGGSISSHYPINHFILESGKQDIALKILPLKGESFLRKDGSVKIKIHFYDASTNDYTNLIEVFQFTTPDLSQQEFPYLEFKGEFEAEIPYKIEGWKNSINIKDNKEEINQALKYYQKLHSDFQKGDYKTIESLQQIKLKEIDTALYIKESNNTEEWR